MRRVSVRPENAHQSALLRLLRDDGPISRAELGEAVHLSRSKLAVELDRLTEIGLVESQGLAASRGGRRSAIVGLAARLRFLAVDIGATSVDVAVTDGGLTVLGQVAEPIDVRDGPDAVLAVVLDLVGKLRGDGLAVDLHGAGVGVPGPVSFRDGVPVAPPIMPGWNQYPVRSVLSQHLGCPVLVDNDVNIMALGEMHAGLAAPSTTCCSSRSVPASAAASSSTARSTAAPAAAPATSGTSGSTTRARSAPAATSAASRRTSVVRRWRGTPPRRPVPAGPTCSPSGWPAAGRLTSADVAAAAAAGDQVAVELVRDGGHRLGLLLAGLVSFFNPGMVVLGGEVAAGLGHPLLAELRSVVYRRSLPLATGNLPIVLSELGPQAGVVGAARMISDSVLSHD